MNQFITLTENVNIFWFKFFIVLNTLWRMAVGEMYAIGVS